MRFEYKKIFAVIYAIIPQLLFGSEAACNVRIIDSSPNTIVIEVAIDSVNVIQKQIDSEWLTDISVKDCAFTDIVGLPKLPVKSILLGIPSVGKPVLHVEKVEQTQESLGKLVTVEPLSISPTSGDADEHFTYSQLEIKDWYPSSVAILGEVGYVRDQRIAQLEIHPVQYNPITKITRIIRRMRLCLSFENIGTIVFTSSSNNISPKESGGFDMFFQCNVVNYEQAKQWKKHPPRSATLLKSSLGGGNKFKLTVDQDGVYAITGRELAEAGADLADVDLQTLKLANKGKLVPLLVEGEGDGIFDLDDKIIFIGNFNRGEYSYYSPYTMENVYWLSWGGSPGVRFSEVSGYPASDNLDRADVMRHLIHLEKDDEYQRLQPVPNQDVDHWFWHPMSMGSDFPFELPVTVPANEGRATVRISMRGLTHLAQSPDHHVVAKLNGEVVGEAIWDNQDEALIKNNDIDPSLLVEGANTLKLEFPADLGVDLDGVLLNWIEFEYNRLFVAVNDTLRFSYPDYHQGVPKVTHIWGFSRPDIYILDTSGRHITNLAIEKGDDSYRISFKNTAVGSEVYYAVASSQIKNVNKLEKYRPTTIVPASGGADYVIISHTNWLEQANRLAQFRERQGLRTFVIDVQTIFDEYSYGIYDPRAIQRFLKDAYANWAPPALSYVLLFGDTSHYFDKMVWDDDIKARRKYPTFVPTMMVYTSSWGMCSSDNYFACVNGDDLLPDLFIGRLPVNSTEQARILVDKIISYEQKLTEGDWRNTVCIATGNGEFFEFSAQYLYDNFVPDYAKVARISTDVDLPYYGSTSSLADIINRGAVLLNFIGHGGGGVYFDSELFLNEDVERLSNLDMYPIVFSMTCFVGHFSNPEKPSLSEAMLYAENSGIVGHFGAAGKAYLYGDFFLNNALFEQVFQKNSRVLGEVTTFAKLEMINEAKTYWDHVKNYVLLGDPATRLALSNETIDLSVSPKSVMVGDTVFVRGTIQNSLSGTVTVLIYDQMDSLRFRKKIPYSEGKFSQPLCVFDDSLFSFWGEKGGIGHLRAHLSDEQKDGVGGTLFSVVKPNISEIKVEPENPTFGEEIYFEANIDLSSKVGSESLKSVRCLWSLTKADWQILEMAKISDVRYRTVEALKLKDYVEVFYKIQALGSDGMSVLAETPLKSFKIPRKCNLFSRADYVRIGGTDSLQILLTISNLGETDAGPFDVKISEVKEDLSLSQIGDPLHVSGVIAQQDTIVSYPWPNGSSGRHKIRIDIDPADEVDESTDMDNSFYVEFNVLSSADGTAGEFRSTDHNVSVIIPPKGMDRSSSMIWRKVATEEYFEAMSSAQCERAKLADGSLWAVYQLEIADTSVAFTKPFRIRFYYDRSDAQTNAAAQKGALRVYKWNSQLSNWIGLKTDNDPNLGYAITEINYTATTFALLESLDDQAPEITVSFEGQNFADGDIVSQTPAISIVIEDASGLDMKGGAFTMSLNGDLLSDADFSLYQNSEVTKRATCTYNPTLKVGEYELVVVARDIHGNQAVAETHFSTLGEFSFQSIANHPNPFADETIIAFRLSESAETVDVNVFTSSGRNIWSAELADVTGYVELDWDGRDSGGDEVANGVYYLKVTARRGEQTIETIEKMAKLK